MTKIVKNVKLNYWLKTSKIIYSITKKEKEINLLKTYERNLN